VKWWLFAAGIRRTMCQGWFLLSIKENFRLTLEVKEKSTEKGKG
jgi:hypothetical protein